MDMKGIGKPWATDVKLDFGVSSTKVIFFPSLNKKTFYFAVLAYILRLQWISLIIYVFFVNKQYTSLANF